MRAEALLSELTECCRIAAKHKVIFCFCCAGFRVRMLSDLVDCCESSQSVVTAYGVLSDVLAAAGSSLKAKDGQVSLQVDQQIIILNISCP